MKKIIAVAVLLLCTLFLAPVAQGQESVHAAFRKPGASLPHLKIVDTAGKVYTEQSFKNDAPFFLVMFNPTCDHCEKMAKLIGDHAAAFKQCRIAFMAVPPTMPYLSFFYQGSGIGRHPEITVGVDSAEAINKLYEHGKALPQINVYDKNRKLVRTFYGDTPLDSLKKYVP